ncbi:MAG TPA: GspJ family type II secretion system protein [Phycisphaerae bacterium]
MRKSKAFTLFELLVAMLIVVILVGTLAATMSLAFKEKRAAEETVEFTRDLQTIGDFWVADVSTALPPASQPDPTTATSTAPANNGLSAISGLGLNSTSGALGGDLSATNVPLAGAFEGDTSSMSFFITGTESKNPIHGDVRYIEYGLEPARDGTYALVRRMEDNLLSDDTDVEPPSVTLLTGVRSLSFQYWDGTQWLDSWDSTANLDTIPYAVRMQVILEPIRAGGDIRMIKRTATVWCAAPATESTDSTTGAVGGLSGGILGN